MPANFNEGTARGPGLSPEELRGIGRGIAEVGQDLRDLAGLEIEHAKAEMGENFGLAARSAGLGLGAVLLGVVAISFLLTAVMFALALKLSLWGAALVTAIIACVLTAGVGYAALQGFKNVHFVPERTIRSVQEDIQWLRNPRRSSVRSMPDESSSPRRYSA